MKKVILCLCFGLIVISSYGQYESKPASGFDSRNVVLKLGVITPSVALEKRLTSYSTFLLSYQTGFNFSSVNNEPVKTTVIHQLKGAGRLFYNIEKRDYKGKRTEKFGGNFVSLVVLKGWKSDVNPSFVSIGPTWGFQRNWAGFIHFSLELGLGRTFSEGNSGVSWLSDLKLGFAL